MTELYRMYHLGRLYNQDLTKAIQHVSEIRNNMAEHLRLAEANPQFFLKELYYQTASSTAVTNSAICLLAPSIFDFVYRKVRDAAPDVRLRIYKIVFNVADVLCIPDHIMELLSRVQSPKEAALFINICSQLETPLGLEFALLYTQTVKLSKNDMANVADAVYQLICAVYQQYDITAALLHFLPYVHGFYLGFLISEGLLNRDVIIEKITQSVMYSAIGLKLCYFYDIEPATHLLYEMLQNASPKARKYAYLLVCKHVVYELEDSAMETIRGIIGDYRFSRLDKAELIAAGRECYLNRLSHFLDSL